MEDYLQDSVTVEADVENLAAPQIMLAAATSPDALGTDNVFDLDSINELTDGIQQLNDAMSQLMDGASQLEDGVSQLADGTLALLDGASQSNLCVWEISLDFLQAVDTRHHWHCNIHRDKIWFVLCVHIIPFLSIFRLTNNYISVCFQKSS